MSFSIFSSSSSSASAVTAESHSGQKRKSDELHNNPEQTEMNEIITAIASTALNDSNPALASAVAVSTLHPAFTALTPTDSNPVRKFKDNSSPIHYGLFCKALQETLGAYKSSSKDIFPFPLLNLIAEFVEIDDFTAPVPSVSTSLSQGREFVSSIGFGKKMWNDYFGDIGEAPPLPNDICAILKSPCPFFSGKTVEQSHMLVLIPETLNGKPMTLKRLFYELFHHKSTYNKISLGFMQSSFLRRFGEVPFEKSHWVLMTKTTLEGTDTGEGSEICRGLFGARLPELSGSKCCAIQSDILERHPNYKVPTLAQAITAIFMECLVTGIYHISKTYTRCSNTFTNSEKASSFGKTMIGLFKLHNEYGHGGLKCEAYYSEPGEYEPGIAVLRKFPQDIATASS